MIKILFMQMLLGLSFAHAEEGVTKTEIRIGSTGALSGDVAEIGGGMANGAKSYYDRVNAEGGVAGRKIVFLPKDDHYEPIRAVSNVHDLTEKDHIFALIGGNGTPIAQAIMPLVEEKHLPFLFTMTGGAILFPDPPKKNLFQVRMGYAEEAKKVVKFVVEKMNIKDIGVFYQDDAFGIAGRSGVEKQLSDFHLKLNGIGTYQRNTVDVDKAVEALKSAKPKAVYIQAVGKAGIEFIKKCVEKGFNPIFLGQSVLGSFQVRDAVGKLPVEMYISEIVPSPLDTRLPLIQNYQKDMASIGKKSFDYFSLEGYIGAVLFIENIRRSGAEVSRDTLNKTFEAMTSFDLGGVTASFSPTKHYALDKNFIFHLKDGQLSPVLDK